MTWLDLRTRTDDDVRPIDFGDFVGSVLPAALATSADLAAEAMVATGLESITIAVDDVPSTWRVVDGLLVVTPTDDGRARADLSPEIFSGFVNDTRSAVAVMISGEPVMSRGRITHLIDWEIVLRALLDGRPAHRPGAVRFLDRSGDALDLSRRFTLDDDPAEIAWFLEQTGFLLIGDVIDQTTIDVLDRHLTDRRDAAHRDDPTTWWARTSESVDEVCVRFNDLPDDALPAPLGRLTEPIVRALDAEHEFDHIDVLLKPVGVIEGISDLPWHKDCALGLHSHQCAQIVCGVSLSASGSHNGQLGVVAGSHRVNLDQFEVDGDLDLPVVMIDTEPGDVTVHLSCTLHSSTPPLLSERRVAYVTWRLPGTSRDLTDATRNVRDQAGRDTFSPSAE